MMFAPAYLTSEALLDPTIVRRLEKKDVSPDIILQRYNSCVGLRCEWDEFARNYDIIITPSVTGEAPYGLEYTGDSVHPSSYYLFHLLFGKSPQELLITIDSASTPCGHCSMPPSSASPDSRGKAVFHSGSALLGRDMRNPRCSAPHSFWHTSLPREKSGTQR